MEGPSWRAFLIMLGFNLSYVSVANGLVWLEPLAAGSGIPEIKSFLNGIDLPRVVSERAMGKKGGTVRYLLIACCSNLAFFFFVTYEVRVSTVPRSSTLGFSKTRHKSYQASCILYGWAFLGGREGLTLLTADIALKQTSEFHLHWLCKLLI